MDDDTRTLLRNSIRGLFESGADVAAGLGDLGWSEVVADDPAAANDLFFTEQGALGRASAVLDTVAYAESDGTHRAVVHPINGRTSAQLVGDHVQIDGVLLSDADEAVVATPDGTAFVVDLTAPASAGMPIAGFDPGSRLRRTRLRVERGALTEVNVDWAAISAAAERALASELVGNGTAMVRLAVEQITGRTQFGRPIGANQSPRHRLAESYALIRGAAELSAVAWRTGRDVDARTAKTYAGYAVDTASRACLQVCGAIGLTTEHALPGYVTRSRILDALYGGWAESTADIGRRLLESGSVPTATRL